MYVCMVTCKSVCLCVNVCGCDFCVLRVMYICMYGLINIYKST